MVGGGHRNPPPLSPRGSGGGLTPRQGAWGQSPQKTEGYPEPTNPGNLGSYELDLGSRGSGSVVNPPGGGLGAEHPENVN